VPAPPVAAVDEPPAPADPPALVADVEPEPVPPAPDVVEPVATDVGFVESSPPHDDACTTPNSVAPANTPKRRVDAMFIGAPW
jgi:hypothetical protein